MIHDSPKAPTHVLTNLLASTQKGLLMDNMNVRPHRGLVEIIDEVMVSGEEKNARLKIAKHLEAYHKLDPSAGVDNVVVFETEAELRDEVIKTCSFDLGVEDDGSLRGRQFRHRSEDGERTAPLNLTMPEVRLHCVSQHLAWLGWTREYKRVPSLWGFSLQDGVALFHRQRQLRDHENQDDWYQWRDCYDKEELPFMPRACFVVETGKLYSENPEKMRSAKKMSRSWVEEDRHITGVIMGHYERVSNYVATEADFDASKVFIPYGALVGEDMAVILSKDLIDLSKSSQSSLLLKLKEAIDSRLGEVLGSQPETRCFAPDEIYGMIGRYWEELIYSPWDEKTAKEYAVLKNLCKRGSDDVNVWSEKTQGLFGFKVRSRDHDWIKGQIYCPADALSPKPTDDIGVATWEARAGITYKIGGSVYSGFQYHTMFSGEVISVGRCKFLISRERDR